MEGTCNQLPGNRVTLISACQPAGGLSGCRCGRQPSLVVAVQVGEGHQHQRPRQRSPARRSAAHRGCRSGPRSSGRAPGGSPAGSRRPT